MKLSNNKIEPVNLDEKLQKQVPPPSFFLSIRFLLSFILFLGYSLNYIQRTNMSIGIVCMVNSTAVIGANVEAETTIANVTLQPGCQETLSLKLYDGKFVWSKADQGLILSSYYYGYILTQLAGGWLSSRLGARLVISISILVPSIATLVTPPIANLDIPPLLMVLRFIIGLFHGLMFSSGAFLFGHWAPPQEKSRMIGLAQSGLDFGSLVSSIFGGILCEHGFYEGWGSIFIIFGAVGLVWVVLFFLLASESPTNHKLISETEKLYIVSNIQQTSSSKNSKIPWKAIFTSPACLSLFFTNFTANWGGYLFLSLTPTYLKDILKFDIQANGFYSAIPFICAYFAVLISSYISDILISKQILSTKNCRKLFNTLGMAPTVIISIVLGFIDCSQPILGVALLSIGVGTIGCQMLGFVVNLNDLGGKNLAGILYGISNTFGTIPGILAPYFVGLMTPKGTLQEWRIVFIVTAVIYFVGAIPFLLFTQTDVPKWAQEEEAANADDIGLDQEEQEQEESSKSFESPLKKTP